MRTDPSESAPLILIVDDEALMRLQLKRSLQQEGYRVIEALDGEQCLARYLQHQPDMVLLDALMPVMDGFNCCAQLQQLPVPHPAPVLMITGLEDKQSVDQAFEAGATDFVTKPIHWAVLRQRVRRLIAQHRLQQQQAVLYQQLEATNRVLQRLAAIDELTHVANRRRFDAYLAQEWFRLARERQPLSLILCDIDCFKSYNDTYGHPGGDRCLQQVAAALNSVAKRPADLVARYGGEEFAIILPNTGLVGALQVAEMARAAIQALKLVHVGSSVSPFVTLSLGVSSTVPHPRCDAAILITTADKALYQAKAAGRDRAVSARSLPNSVFSLPPG